MTSKAGEIINRNRLTDRKEIMTLGRIVSRGRFKAVDELSELFPRLVDPDDADVIREFIVEGPLSPVREIPDGLERVEVPPN